MKSCQYYDDDGNLRGILANLVLATTFLSYLVVKKKKVEAGWDSRSRCRYKRGLLQTHGHELLATTGLLMYWVK